MAPSILYDVINDNIYWVFHSLVSSGKHLSTMDMYFSSVVRTAPPVGSSFWRGGTPLTKVWRDNRRRRRLWKRLWNWVLGAYNQSLWSRSPPGCRDTPGSSWLWPPGTDPSTSWFRQRKGRRPRTEPRPPEEPPGPHTQHTDINTMLRICLILRNNLHSERG